MSFFKDLGKALSNIWHTEPVEEIRHEAENQAAKAVVDQVFGSSAEDLLTRIAELRNLLDRARNELTMGNTILCGNRITEAINLCKEALK